MSVLKTIPCLENYPLYVCLDFSDFLLQDIWFLHKGSNKRIKTTRFIINLQMAKKGGQGARMSSFLVRFVHAPAESVSR